MNMELKLQAMLDGELSGREAQRTAAEAAANPEATALLNELRGTREFLRGNEPEHKLAESREFYWSRIQRAIEHAEQAPAAGGPTDWLAGLRRLLAPVSALAVLVLLAVVSFQYQQGGGSGDPLRELVEAENLSEHMDSIAYRSHADNMVIVYLYEKDQPVSATPVEDGTEPVFQ
jgi:hypothetical protein